MKYSKQREIILAIVKESDKHPTAEEVYMEARKRLPSISLGTVYRNLHILVELGMIKQIKGLDEKDRFDKTLKDHGHLLCTVCHKVYDADDVLIDTLKDNIEKESGFVTQSYNIVVTGICHTCMKERRYENEFTRN
ncbi:MAG: transcriptional repressor [Bacilli bacterium]|nr:transcriptional repressor [Bacilli bacterium]